MNENGNYHFETKEYCPPNLGLQEIAATLKKEVILIDTYELTIIYICLLKIFIFFP